MIVLGLQFGHDGSACVLRDGRIVSYVSREREARIKHAIGITTREIDLALTRAGVCVSAINYVAIVSTQNLELLTGLIDDFEILMERHKADTAPSTLASLLANDKAGVGPRLSFALRETFAKADDQELHHRIYRALCPEHELVREGRLASVGWLDEYITRPEWQKGATLAEIGRSNYAAPLATEACRFGFHLPVSVRFRGNLIPGGFINHHLAHAGSSYYVSNFPDAAIVTHDGFSSGKGYSSGLIFRGRGNEIVPVCPHHLALGGLYDRVANSINLGPVGGAGKLMGLAPYGKPAFYSEDYVGNWYDIQQRFGTSHAKAWLAHIGKVAPKMGYDLATAGVKEHITGPLNADIAASTQKVFEESYLRTIKSVFGVMQASGIATDRLCLSGGTALNCPSNSKIFNEGPFKEIFIEPHCGDDGLAIGAALYVYHHLYAHPRTQAYATPYLGHTFTDSEVRGALARQEGKVRFDAPSDYAACAARDVFDGKIIAWFDKGSEVGPRALGHRSLVADPRKKENWARVNKLKEREWWRPLAPSVLASEARHWFSGVPELSPYMLFTGQVTSDALPAITHVDGSARIQTVDQSSGAYADLIREFFTLSSVPVVLNTSFNGPREPIVETPDQALVFLLSTELDTLYLQGYRVTRAR